jgi:hypothetical protein
MGTIIMMINVNIIIILLTLIINILPWIIADKILSDPSINNPFDPEGVLVVLFFAEIIIFLIWLCWFLYLLFLNKKTNLSLLIISVLNLPYIVFYGYGHVSIINLLLTPLLIFINRNIIQNPPYQGMVLILINIIAWFFLLYLIYKKRNKKENSPATD